VKGDPLGSSFGAPEQSPGFLLWQVSVSWGRRLRAALEPIGLTHTQFVILAGATWLTREGEPVTQVMIATHARLDLTMTSQVIRSLEARELLSRTGHPSDARAKCIAPTAAGAKLAKRAIQIIEAEDRAFFATLGPKTSELVRLLSQLATEVPD
jgi:DNA-binding MarR family transcriptional regulator